MDHRLIQEIAEARSPQGGRALFFVGRLSDNNIMGASFSLFRLMVVVTIFAAAFAFGRMSSIGAPAIFIAIGIWLSETNISDAGLEQIAEISGLAKLQIRGTQVTDSGLQHLRKLSKLQWLDLADTEVTKAAEASLEDAIPGLTVVGIY